ncbi:unnamed protein product [Brachionus calyciflorus]|uniref:Phospholipase A2-like central domain-containing protein n=1 Tax=Brachionus calyciflorus TaxID=104777 RepID=A0A813TRD3_9BILA|nr:unnamed protein product [Brachionus calyciflorus]
MNIILTILIQLIIINQAFTIFISKGTLWCGMGNNAKNCKELGEYKETDSCCRMHDLCPYKFTRKNREHNGFRWSWRKIYTLTHCECDLMFKQCLEEEPIKKGSAKIWHSFNKLGIKCYSFLPCDQNNDLWKSIDNRESGSCFNGLKVIVFHSVDDYTSYMKNQFTKEELIIEKNILNSSLDRFYIEKTMKLKYANCLNETYEFKSKIINNFNEYHKLDDNIIEIQARNKHISENLNEIYINELMESKSKTTVLLAKVKDALMKMFSILT